MKWIRRLVFSSLLLALLLALAAFFWLPRLNDYRTDGEWQLPGLTAPVTVSRDEKGMAFVRAETLDDALFAQGFVTAQDRLFQMQLVRLLAQGRLTELAGDRARASDVRMRTIGLHHLAKIHGELLTPETRQFFQSYVDGINAYIEHAADELPVEFRLAKLAPDIWTVDDSLSILYYMGWNSSANLNQEIVAHLLVEALGPERAFEIFPLNLNPDAPPVIDTGVRLGYPASLEADAEPDDGTIAETIAETGDAAARLGEISLSDGISALANLQDAASSLGSNNWVVAAERSPGSKPVLAGDPHLDARMLPGVWYPLGILLPDSRAIGVTVPGMPGMSIGRTDHIAVSITNNYGDAQDLYIETVDPNDDSRYLEGGESLPFELRQETLRIRDAGFADGFRQETIDIRSTRRGPIVSDVLSAMGLESVAAGQVMTLRWAAAATMMPQVGFKELMAAESVAEFADALQYLTVVPLNFVLADSQGNIGWQVSGRLPNRSRGGLLPEVVSADQPWQDNWQGWIPWPEMPHAQNPERGWLATANHYLMAPDYPYYYSAYAASSYRYRRLQDLMAPATELTVDDHWAMQRDTLNLLAEVVAPLMANALQQDDDLRDLGDVLAGWNHQDDPQLAAPAIFQATYRHFAWATFVDELGEARAGVMLRTLYFWQERLEQMTLQGTSTWFDDTTTEAIESRDDLFRRAARQAREQLSAAMGANVATWTWGAVHTMDFFHPLRRDGLLSANLGSGPHPMGGSAETLYRGWYDYDKPFAASHTASLRMVVDLDDPDKIRAVLPGGVAARTLHPHQKNQIEDFMSGATAHWWFSDQAITDHTRSTLTLRPQ